MTNWRRVKRIHNKHVKKLKVGCRDHPGIITELNVSRDPWSSDVMIKSLLDGVEESCGIMHCGPEPLTKETALRMVTEK